MSKSKLNVINPDDVIDQYGVDSTRLYELFTGPISASAPWKMEGLEGMYRFLAKVWRLIVDEESGELALEQERIQQLIAGKMIRRVIVVKDRLVNVVVG